MISLTDFPLPRIAEEEAELTPPTEWNGRAHAQCEGKRRIVDLHTVIGYRSCPVCDEGLW